MNTNRTFSSMYTFRLLFATFLFAVLASVTNAQTEDQRRIITRDYDKPSLVRISEAAAKGAADAKKQALDFARIRNIPVFLDLPDGGKAELMFLDPAGQPIYYGTDNAAAAITTRVNHLNSGGSTGFNLDGQNMVAYIWDAGYARSTHQEYDGSGGTNRVQPVDTSAEGGYTLDSHGAHVTGTIVASGVTASAKGMAPQARLRGYKWNSDLSEATAAASNGMLLSNHSYGYVQSSLSAYYFGGYLTVARDWDNVMYNAPYYLMVKSAGNNGTTNYNTSPLDPAFPQYDKLTDRSNCKNNLVVASCNDASVDASGNLLSVTISSFSSQGPTDDLRVKPDITANGASLYSTVETADNAYGSKSGTSMASPNTTGTLLLLQQHAHQVTGAYLRAATLKGLVLHTADEVGIPGPDAIWGWGLLNGKKAAETISRNGNQSIINELTLSQAQTYTFQVTSDGINKLMASISWTDPAGTASTALNSTTPRLVNDLDIRITQNASTYLPWMLTGVNTNGTGDNIRDPYERVDINGASGTYTVTVSHKGTLSSGSQRFSLIVTGVMNTSLCTATVPANLTNTQLTATTASLAWDAVAFASYEFRYRPVGALSWTIVTTSVNSVSLQGLNQGTAYEAEVRSICPDGSASAFSATLNFTTPVIVITYCNSSGTSTIREFINRVQIGGINNTSGNNNGYGNFLSQSASVVRGSAYTVTIIPGWTSSARSEAYRVWIDYNRDGDFLDSGEQVYARNKTTATSVSGTFTIPLTAATGTTRMRVSMKYNSNPTSCETFAYGEVEDYTISIGAPSNRIGGEENSAPTGLAFMLHPNPVHHTLHVSFQEAPADFEWIVVDLTGRTLMEGRNQLRIDVNELPGGTYLLLVRSDGKQSAGRFIKD